MAKLALADDRDLMLRTRSGDREALAVLYGRHSQRLFQFVRRWTLDPALSEDLVHDVFLKLLDPSIPFKAGDRFDVWLFRVTRNHVIDRHRRFREVPQELPESAAASSEDVLNGLIAEEDLARLQAAMDQVAPAHREVLLLRTSMDLSHSELARELGCTPGAARVRLHRAVAALRGAWFSALGGTTNVP